MNNRLRRLLALATAVIGLTTVFTVLGSSATLAQGEVGLVGQPGASDGAPPTASAVGKGWVSAGSTESASFTGSGLEFYTEGSGNHIPDVRIGAAAYNSTFNEGSTIGFTATASDFEDGDITAKLLWLSSLDGVIGSGGSCARTDLSVGIHTITATATDNGGQSGLDVRTITVFADAPVLVGAGDIADDKQWDEATAALLDNIPGTVITLGDNAYPNGTAAEFSNFYDPTWGRHKARTRPASGNHDYDTPNATAYYDYFGAAAGDPTKGYCSYDVGSWHIIVLNTQCSEVGG